MVGLLAAAACGDDDNSPTSPSPTPGAVIALAGNLTFGSVTVGATATATLTITNSGSSPLTVTDITYPSGFTGNLNGGTIAAAGSQPCRSPLRRRQLRLTPGRLRWRATTRAGPTPSPSLGPASSRPPRSRARHRSAPTTSTVLAGATIRFVDGANQGKSAVTGSDGRYEITGLSGGGYTVSATLAGYATPRFLLASRARRRST